MFITFTKQYDHFLDNIKNGFLLGEHKVEFLPSTYELVKSLMVFWDEYQIKGKTISKLIDLWDANGGLTDKFWKTFADKLRDDFTFNAEVSLMFGQFKSAPIKMKCFTEIRDNQKINRHHTGYFGDFGILMTEDWLLANGGCPVVYVSNSMSLTNILGRNFSMMQTLDHAVRTLAGIKKGHPIHHSAFFDFMSFVEASKHRYEYEWRIVSGHNLGGQSYLPKIERAKFDISNVHSLYVPDEKSRSDSIDALSKFIPKEKIPQIFLTEEILLTDADIKQIEKIKSRTK